MPSSQGSLANQTYPSFTRPFSGFSNSPALGKVFPAGPIPLCTLLHLAVLPQPRRSAPAVPSSLVSCLAGPPHLPSPAPSGQFSVPTSTRNSATLSHLARSSSSFWMIPAKTPPPHPISPRIYRHASDPDPQQVGVGALSAKVGRCPPSPSPQDALAGWVWFLRYFSSPAPEFLRGCRALQSWRGTRSANVCA